MFVCGKDGQSRAVAVYKHLVSMKIVMPAKPVAPVAQRYHVTSDTLGRDFDPGKRDFSH